MILNALNYANMPFQIGSLKLSHRLIQAPLAGISCAPFRELFSKYTKPAYAVTEMISAHSMIQHETLKARYLAHSPKEGPWCIQLSGSNPELMYQATQIAARYQPDLIDLNCGCPKPKIRSRGCGSALMDSLENLHNVVTAMRQATTLPLTVKIRVGGQTNDKAYLEAATMIEASGADAIIVHGRHHSEDYDVAANYQHIKDVVDLVNIPVIANGDVRDRVSMQRCFQESGATAIMIARGSLGRPWLFQELLGYDCLPSASDVLNIFQVHIEQLATLEGSNKVALLQARRLLKWYFPSLTARQLACCYELHDFKKLCFVLNKFLSL